MKKTFRLFISISILFCIFGLKGFASSNIYNDIAGHKMEGKIVEYTNKGLLKGYPDGTFRPDDEMKRAELVTLINRYFAIKDVDIEENYKDIEGKEWYAVETARAKNYHYFDGETINPQQTAQKNDVLLAISSLIDSEEEKKKISVGDFSGLDNLDKTTREAIMLMAEIGYIDLQDNQYNGEQAIKRADMIEIIDKALGFIVTSEEDLKNIPENTQKITLLNADVPLNDLKLKVDIHIPIGIKKEVKIENSTIDGKLICSGNNINIVNSNVKSLIVSKNNNKTNINVQGGIIAEAKIKNKTIVNVHDNVYIQKLVTLKETELKTDASIKIANVSFESPTTISGKGQIEKATIKSEEVVLENSPKKTVNDTGKKLVILNEEKKEEVEESKKSDEKEEPQEEKKKEDNSKIVSINTPVEVPDTPVYIPPVPQINYYTVNVFASADGINIPNANILIDNVNYTSDANGKIVLSLTEGNHTFSCSINGYMPFGIQNINIYQNNQNIGLNLSKIKNNCNFIVKDIDSDELLSNAAITINGITKNTDANGKTLFELQNGNYNASIILDKYDTQNISLVVAGNALTKQILMKKSVVPPKKVKIIVKDNNLDIIKNAQITIGSQIETTNENGEVEFLLSKGDYLAEIYKQYFEVKTLNIKVEELDLLKEVTLNPHTLKIQINDGDNKPLENVQVKLDGNIKQTDIDGKVEFLVDKGNKNLICTKNEYETINNNIEIKEESKELTIVINKLYLLDFEVFDENNLPIKDAKITLGEHILMSDENGLAAISLKKDNYTIDISKEGYKKRTEYCYLDFNTTYTIKLEKAINITSVSLSSNQLSTNFSNAIITLTKSDGSSMDPYEVKQYAKLDNPNLSINNEGKIVVTDSGTFTPDLYTVEIRTEGSEIPIKQTFYIYVYKEGDGSSINPFGITNTNLIMGINEGVDKSYELENDITMSDWRTKIIYGSNGSVFNGNNHTISNLKIVYGANGLFFSVAEGATVKNIVFENPNSTRGAGLGAVCYENSGNIENILVNNMNFIGGGKDYNAVGAIAGLNRNTGSIINCHLSSGVISSGYGLGGIAGWNLGVMSKCSAKFTMHQKAFSSAGGLAGANTGTITDCFAVLDHKAYYANGGYTNVGGLVGANGGIIDRTYAIINTENLTGSDTAKIKVAGLVGTSGWNGSEYNGTLSNSVCLSTALDEGAKRIYQNTVSKHSQVLTNNFANKDMTIGGAVVTENIEGNKINGANINVADFANQTWLSTNLPSWDFTNTWKIEGLLPNLRY